MSKTPSDLYHGDFVAWADQQAALLRGMRVGDAGLDIENLAAEVEGLGRAEIVSTTRVVRRVLSSLAKIAAEPGSDHCHEWVEQAGNDQSELVIHSSNNTAERIDLQAAWSLAVRVATDSIRESGGEMPSFPSECPVSWTQLTKADFSPRLAAERIAARLENHLAATSDRPKGP